MVFRVVIFAATLAVYLLHAASSSATLVSSSDSPAALSSTINSNDHLYRNVKDTFFCREQADSINGHWKDKYPTIATEVMGKYFGFVEITNEEKEAIHEHHEELVVIVPAIQQRLWMGNFENQVEDPPLDFFGIGKVAKNFQTDIYLMITCAYMRWISVFGTIGLPETAPSQAQLESLVGFGVNVFYSKRIACSLPGYIRSFPLYCAVVIIVGFHRAALVDPSLSYLWPNGHRITRSGLMRGLWAGQHAIFVIVHLNRLLRSWMEVGRQLKHDLNPISAQVFQLPSSLPRTEVVKLLPRVIPNWPSGESVESSDDFCRFGPLFTKVAMHLIVTYYHLFPEAIQQQSKAMLDSSKGLPINTVSDFVIASSAMAFHRLVSLESSTIEDGLRHLMNCMNSIELTNALLTKSMNAEFMRRYYAIPKDSVLETYALHGIHRLWEELESYSVLDKRLSVLRYMKLLRYVVLSLRNQNNLSSSVWTVTAGISHIYKLVLAALKLNSNALDTMESVFSLMSDGVEFMKLFTCENGRLESNIAVSKELYNVMDSWIMEQQTRGLWNSIEDRLLLTFDLLFVFSKVNVWSNDRYQAIYKLLLTRFIPQRYFSIHDDWSIVCLPAEAITVGDGISRAELFSILLVRHSYCRLIAQLLRVGGDMILTEQQANVYGSTTPVLLKAREMNSEEAVSIIKQTFGISQMDLAVAVSKCLPIGQLTVTQLMPYLIQLKQLVTIWESVTNAPTCTSMQAMMMLQQIAAKWNGVVIPLWIVNSIRKQDVISFERMDYYNAHLYGLMMRKAGQLNNNRLSLIVGASVKLSVAELIDIHKIPDSSILRLTLDVLRLIALPVELGKDPLDIDRLRQFVLEFSEWNSAAISAICHHILVLFKKHQGHNQHSVGDVIKQIMSERNLQLDEEYLTLLSSHQDWSLKGIYDSMIGIISGPKAVSSAQNNGDSGSLTFHNVPNFPINSFDIIIGNSNSNQHDETTTTTPVPFSGPGFMNRNVVSLSSSSSDSHQDNTSSLILHASDLNRNILQDATSQAMEDDKVEIPDGLEDVVLGLMDMHKSTSRQTGSSSTDVLGSTVLQEQQLTALSPLSAMNNTLQPSYLMIPMGATINHPFSVTQSLTPNSQTVLPSIPALVTNRSAPPSRKLSAAAAAVMTGVEETRQTKRICGKSHSKRPRTNSPADHHPALELLTNMLASSIPNANDEAELS